MADGKNRRESVRATDRVMLAYKKITPEKFDEIVEDHHQGISIYTQEGLGDVQMFVGAQTALDRLRTKDQDLAEVLRHLDNKINLLLKRVKGERSIFDNLKKQKVNLSGKGLSFFSFEPFSPEDIVEVHLVLLPSYTYLYFFAKVVKCDDEGEHQGKTIYRVGSEFSLMMDEDRERLVQHSFKQQSLSLRSRRQEDDD